MQLLIKIPTRQRPSIVAHVLQLYAKLVIQPEHTRILLTVDDDDVSMRGFDAQAHAGPIPVQVVSGPRSSKIGAVNRDLPGDQPWDILLLGSDDMWPQVPCLDQVIRRQFATHWPDTDGCLWFSDGQQDRLCTYPVMGRAYWERDRHVYHPVYASYYADDEQTEVAIRRGRMAKVPQVLLKHEHHFWSGQVREDGLYRHNRLFKGMDRNTYRDRKAAGFP